jgi:hypothetical protein
MLDSNLRTKPRKCYIWSIAVYGAETWTIRKKRSEIAGTFLNTGEGWRRSVAPIA